MKMSKTIRKMNDKLVGAIKTLNDAATEELTGMSKLDHTIQFDLFPGSLLVNCYFESQEALEKNMKAEKEYQKKLQKLLLKQGIVLKDAKQNLKFILVK
jgi:hypothetical protein